jgi:peptidyl-prolyl cis-trans isomerase D
MAALAAEYNAEYNKIDIRESDFELPEVESSRQMIRWAYEAEVGDVTEALQFAGSFVVARLLEIHEDGVAPLDRVRVEAELGAIKKKKAEAFIREMQGITDLDQAATDLNLMIEKADNIIFESFSIPGMGREPEILGKIFTMGQGDLSVPIEGNGGVFIIQIDRVDPVNLSDIDVNIPREQLTLSRASKVGDDRSSAVFEALKDCSDIEDQRFKFY